MKVILEFNLPDEQSEYTVASKAISWYSIVWDIDRWLRERLKYGHKFKNADDALEAARDELYLIMERNKVDFNEVE